MSDTAARLFREQVERWRGRVALCELAAGGAPRDRTLTWGEWGEQAQRFAAALIAAGHRRGEAVAILAGNSVIWPVADLGTLLAGGVAVGIYPTSAPGQVRRILVDSGATTLVTDGLEQCAKAETVRGDVPSLRTIVCPRIRESGVRRVGWEAWLGRGAHALHRGVAGEIERRVGAAAPADTALLIYTSGSTGEPKGACISHRYLLASAASIRDTLGLLESDKQLSLLPFCHAAERVFGLYTRICCGMEAALVADHARIRAAAAAFSPTVFGGLPRFYEKAYEALRAEQECLAGDERARWERALELGRRRAALRRVGDPVPASLLAEWRSTGAQPRALLAEMFGGRVRLATSGGAALPAEVAQYLDALGLTVLGAYGLTEHLCAAFNRPGRPRFDAAGPPMPGTELRIAPGGEILIRRGPLTFSGYHARPEDTRDAFTPDGKWLRTGDLGELDGDGALRVTGRSKELIALSTGKKVAPLPIEARLMEDPWIGQAVLYGEGRKFVSALLCLRRPVVEAWTREHRDGDGRVLPGDYVQLLEHPALVARVQEAVDGVNAGLSRPERIRRWTVLERDLSTEEDELTPTLKVRRPVVAERFRDRFEALYQEAR